MRAVKDSSSTLAEQNELNLYENQGTMSGVCTYKVERKETLSQGLPVTQKPLVGENAWYTHSVWVQRPQCSNYDTLIPSI